jgi:hypothetical protein
VRQDPGTKRGDLPMPGLLGEGEQMLLQGFAAWGIGAVDHKAKATTTSADFPRHGEAAS